MDGEAAKSKAAIGFLTVVEHPQHGLFGGYLLLNGAGRPLEFHCTAPLKPSRAQEILYGPTLRPYLYGEQIGGTLVAKAKTRPLVVCTDTQAVLALRDFASLPVVLVLGSDPADKPIAETVSEPSAESAETGPAADPRRPRLRLDSPHRQQPGLHVFELGRHSLGVPVSHADDRRLVSERLGTLADQLDLGEPFDRIREALDEAQRGAR